jgi:hypothetical protein
MPTQARLDAPWTLHHVKVDKDEEPRTHPMDDSLRMGQVKAGG